MREEVIISESSELSGEGAYVGGIYGGRLYEIPLQDLSTRENGELNYMHSNHPFEIHWDILMIISAHL
jgi:hypothetical protein